MRSALGLMLASVVAAIVIAGVWFWTSSPRADAAPPQTTAASQADPLPTAAKQAARDDVDTTAALSKRADATQAAAPAAAPAPAPAPVVAMPKCANPDGLGISRTVVVDTTGGPGFGFLQYKQYDFLTDHEVVLTFDDGPWPTTPAVLKALADECTKAVFFPIGLHTTYHPDILRQVAAAGHTIGAHTWSHAHLASKKITEQQAKDEIEKGFSAVKLALGANPAPFFRFPALAHTPATTAYLGTRNIAMFSVDVDSNDFKSKSSDEVINNVMTKLDKEHKGIILMHDLQKHTAQALPTLLRKLKAGGYKVVWMKAKTQIETLPEYDAMMAKTEKRSHRAGRSATSCRRWPSNPANTPNTLNPRALLDPIRGRFRSWCRRRLPADHHGQWWRNSCFRCTQPKYRNNPMQRSWRVPALDKAA